MFLWAVSKNFFEAFHSLQLSQVFFFFPQVFSKLDFHSQGVLRAEVNLNSITYLLLKAHM